MRRSSQKLHHSFPSYRCPSGAAGCGSVRSCDRPTAARGPGGPGWSGWYRSLQVEVSSGERAFRFERVWAPGVTVRCWGTVPFLRPDVWFFATCRELPLMIWLCTLSGRGVNPSAQSHHRARSQRFRTCQAPRGSADVYQTQIPPGKKIKSISCLSQKMSEELKLSVSTESSGFLVWLMHAEKTFCSLCLPDLIYTRLSPTSLPLSSNPFQHVLLRGWFMYQREVHAKCRTCIFSKVEITWCYW